MDSCISVPRRSCRLLLSKYPKYAGDNSSAILCTGYVRMVYWSQGKTFLLLTGNPDIQNLKYSHSQWQTTRTHCLSRAERWHHPTAAQAGIPWAEMHTFLAAHFASGIFCWHIPLDTGIQHPQQYMHTGEGLGLTDCCLPFLHGWSNLQTDLTAYNDAQTQLPSV